MSESVLPFLDEEVETEAPEAQLEAPETDQPETDQPEQVETTGETTEAASPAAHEEKPTATVPLEALLEEREKRQKAQREADELRQWRTQIEAEKQPKPDFFDNPDAAMSQLQQQVQKEIIKSKLQTSRFHAEREYGAEEVADAYAWFDQNPEHSASLLNEPSPFHAAVEYYKRQKALQEIGNDPLAWRKQFEEDARAKVRAEIEAEYAQKAAIKPAAPPRSLASAPSAGGETPSPGSAFDDMFG